MYFKYFRFSQFCKKVQNTLNRTHIFIITRVRHYYQFTDFYITLETYVFLRKYFEIVLLDS